MLILKSLLLLAIAVASADLVTRTPADVLAKLQVVDAGFRNVTKVVNTWTGSKEGWTPIYDASNILSVYLKSANDTLSKEAAYSCADSNATNTYLANSLEPDTLTAMNAYLAKKAQFNEGGYNATIYFELTRFRQYYMAFFRTYTTKVCSAAANDKSAIAKKIDYDVANAIQKFNSV